MTTLIFVHGIKNESRPDRPNSADIISQSWFEAISNTAKTMGRSLPAGIKVRSAFYGDDLFSESENWKNTPKDGAQRMGAGDDKSEYADPDIAELYREFQEAYGIADADVAQELDPDDDITAVRMADGIHKKWLKAITRSLEKVVPSAGEKYLVKTALVQAAAYLHKHGLKDKIDDQVQDQVFNQIPDGEKVIVVSHSLGTVVSYTLLRKLRRDLNVELLVTMGSPLGIGIVKKRLGPPLVVTNNIKKWVNGADKEDFVALKHELTPKTFGADGIINISDLDNGNDDAHSVIQYLSHPALISEILGAL